MAAPNFQSALVQALVAQRDAALNAAAQSEAALVVVSAERDALAKEVEVLKAQTAGEDAA